MKSLFGKIAVVIAGAVALLGFSGTQATVSSASSGISGKSALYLEHGKYMGNNIAIESWHTSHSSHSSHVSHVSHSSGW